jgi:hypothetical protein
MYSNTSTFMFVRVTWPSTTFLYTSTSFRIQNVCADILGKKFPKLLICEFSNSCNCRHFCTKNISGWSKVGGNSLSKLPFSSSPPDITARRKRILRATEKYEVEASLVLQQRVDPTSAGRRLPSNTALQPRKTESSHRRIFEAKK